MNISFLMSPNFSLMLQNLEVIFGDIMFYMNETSFIYRKANSMKSWCRILAFSYKHQSDGKIHSALCHFFATWHHQTATSCDQFEYKSGKSFHENRNLLGHLFNSRTTSNITMKFIIILSLFGFILGHQMTSQLTSKCSVESHWRIFIENLKKLFQNRKVLFFILRCGRKFTSNAENETQALSTNCMQQMPKNCLRKLFTKTCQTMQTSFGAWRLLQSN